LWEERPLSAFVSVKFSPGSSQTINGYVLGGSFALAHHIDFLVGFSLTPISEPAPGFRVTASQFVAAEQSHGRALAFDSQAMAANLPNAFDGFPVTDTSGKLIYQGDPVTVHYRGGVVLGVSIPLYFKSVFTK